MNDVSCCHQILQLTLNIGDLVGGKFVFTERHFCSFQEMKKPEFTRLQEQKSLSRPTTSSSTANTVDIIPGIIRRIILNNPIHSRNIETSCRDICTKQCPLRRIR